MARNGPLDPTNAANLTFGDSGSTLSNGRDGSNPNFVVGRYAYVIYDEGGLLDVNVCGLGGVGAASATLADYTGNRGPLAMAPLTLTSSSLPTAQQWANLVSWRNPATGATLNTYANYIYSNISASTRFLNTQADDRTFLSRQDLIAYANLNNFPDALPYLGTFSRDVNAPSYTSIPPPASAASAPAYISKESASSAKDPAKAINPDLLMLRFLNGGTINSGGSQLKSRTVKAGDFLLSRRFSLSRLGWIGNNGPANGASATDVWRAFGLVWDQNNYAWAYVSGSGAALPGLAPVSSIKTLYQVSQESPPREPDFFELLKAGILNGSVGQNGGIALVANTFNYGASGDTYIYDQVQSYHIIQIGANIIDQADSDSFPTAIRFGPDPSEAALPNPPPTNPVTFPLTHPPPNYKASTQNPFGTPRTFYGVENLPYITRFFDTYVRWLQPPPPLQNSDIGPVRANSAVYRNPYLGCWMRFEIWNPNEASNLNTSLGLYPTAIQIVATGNVSPDVYSRLGSGGPLVKQNTIPSPFPLDPTASSYIALKLVPVPEPSMVSAANVTSCGTNCSVSNADVAGGKGFVGLYMGTIYAPDWAWSGMQAGTQYPLTLPTQDSLLLTWDNGRINPATTNTPDGATYALQYQDANGWHTYSELKNQVLTVNSGLPTSTSATDKLTLNSANNSCRYGMKIDPRTDRFSTCKVRPVSVDANPTLSGLTVWPDLTLPQGFSADAFVPYSGGTTNWSGSNKPPGSGNNYPATIMENRTTSNVSYSDPDGVQRRGDAAYDSGATLSGIPTATGTNFGANGNLARPVVLNRPFRSVGELGYAFRDLPWKTLDFFTKESGDAGLLDLFSVSDADVVAGRINLNTQNTETLAAALQGTAIDPLFPTGPGNPLSTDQARTLASALANFTTSQPLRSRAEMVTTAVSSGGTPETILTTVGLTTTGQNGKIQRENAIRTLSEAGNVRTWNLLIDIIAQSGRYPQDLKAGASLDSFVPDGEKHYWLHVAIDRYTGKIVDRFLEPVEQ